MLFVIGVGWLVSFLGQLPLGTINLTATQIGLEENFKNAWKYSIGIALIELFYLSLVIYSLDWLMAHQSYFLILGWLSVVIFLTIGVACFISALKQPKKRNFLLNNSLDRFFLGISISALNPAQIPFWFVWTTFVLERGWLLPQHINYFFYILGTGIGTLCGLSIYIYGGKWVGKKINTQQQTINKAIGIIFIIAALWQTCQLVQ